MIISIGLKNRIREQQLTERKYFMYKEKSDNMKKELMAELKVNTETEFYELSQKISPLK